MKDASMSFDPEIFQMTKEMAFAYNPDVEMETPNIGFVQLKIALPNGGIFLEDLSTTDIDLLHEWAVKMQGRYS